MFKKLLRQGTFRKRDSSPEPILTVGPRELLVAQVVIVSANDVEHKASVAEISRFKLLTCAALLRYVYCSDVGTASVKQCLLVPF
jgi:hypothetical protein